MTALAILNLLRRFWWAIPILALSVSLGITRAELEHRTDALKAERAEYAQDIANVRAATEKAYADDLLHVRDVKARQAQLSKRIEDELVPQLAAARADAARYAERLRSASKAPGSGGAAANLPGGPDAPSGPAGAGQTAELDAIACAENTVKAQGWQDWYASVSKVER